MVTQEFSSAFSGGATYTSVICECSITHFCNQNHAWLEDEEELKRLQEAAKKDPQRVVEHEEPVSNFMWEDSCIVFNCSCKRDQLIEKLLWEKRGPISSFINAILKRKKREAEEGLENNEIKM